MTSLSIIIVSWNTYEPLRNCLRALGNWRARDQEVIVIDNASSDGSPTLVRAEFPCATVIENASNLGFAQANNQGLRFCRGRYATLLNSDTIALPEALDALIAFMDRHPQAGACGPRLCLPDGRAQPFSFGNDPTPVYLLRRGLSRLLLRKPLHDWETLITQPVDWVAGTCMVVRRATWEQVGLLDETFFMYFEDNDWCLRMRQRGWFIYYMPQVTITHMGGQSAAKNPAASAAYYRSLDYFYRKHYGWAAQAWLRWLLPVYRRLIRY